MKKKDLIARLNTIYADIECALSDESVMTVGKALTKQNDEIGSLIQELEDESEEKDNDELNEALSDGD